MEQVKKNTKTRISGLGRPAWVFGGAEPDPRFSLANERTFLAWIRTSMAFIAAGVAFHAVALSLPKGIALSVSMILLLLGIVMPPFAWFKRGLTERAMRRNEPLPNSLLEECVVGSGLVSIGILLGIGIIIG